MGFALWGVTEAPRGPFLKIGPVMFGGSSFRVGGGRGRAKDGPSSHAEPSTLSLSLLNFLLLPSQEKVGGVRKFHHCVIILLQWWRVSPPPALLFPG